MTAWPTRPRLPRAIAAKIATTTQLSSRVKVRTARRTTTAPSRHSQTLPKSVPRMTEPTTEGFQASAQPSPISPAASSSQPIAVARTTSAATFDVCSDASLSARATPAGATDAWKTHDAKQQHRRCELQQAANDKGFVHLDYRRSTHKVEKITGADVTQAREAGERAACSWRTRGARPFEETSGAEPPSGGHLTGNIRCSYGLPGHIT